MQHRQTPALVAGVCTDSNPVRDSGSGWAAVINHDGRTNN